MCFLQCIFFLIFPGNRKNTFSVIASSCCIYLQSTFTGTPLCVENHRAVVFLRPRGPVFVISRRQIVYFCTVPIRDTASVRFAIPSGEHISGPGIIIYHKMCDRRYFFSLIKYSIIIHMIAFFHKPMAGLSICIIGNPILIV